MIGSYLKSGVRTYVAATFALVLTACGGEGSSGSAPAPIVTVPPPTVPGPGTGTGTTPPAPTYADAFDFSAGLPRRKHARAARDAALDHSYRLP